MDSKGEKQANGLHLDESGEILCAVLVLPPNLKTAVERSGQAVVKLEIEIAGEAIAPEKVDLSRGYRFSEETARTLWLLQNWCGRWPGSILQLTLDRLEELRTAAGDESMFREHGQSELLPPSSEPLLWIAERCREKSEAEAAPPAKQTSAPERSRKRKSESTASTAKPRLGSIDGSEHFLAIELPSNEHPCYGEIREVVKSERFKLEPSNRKWWLRDRQKVLDFLARYLPSIEQSWELVPTENFQQRTGKIESLKPKIEVAPAGADDGAFSVSINWHGLAEEKIQAVLRKGASHIESGKRVILLDGERVEKIRKLRDRMAAMGKSAGGKSVALKRQALPEVEKMIVEVDPDWVSPQAWRASIERLKNPDAVDLPPLPDRFLSRLRGYQKVGVGWFWNLHKERLGGLMADEMGLGKTVQSLGLIASFCGKRASGKPSLVVCPASLVENWSREASEFVPEIRTHCYHGASRNLSFADLGSMDLVITSYGTLRADRALFLKADFATIIADEAQFFKNPGTETARVMRGLQAESRFALTGTPIENSLEDLVGIGRFAFPTLFGKRATASLDVDTTLAKVRPYLLRRTKEEVLKDLPAKWESRRYVALTDQQTELYREIRRKTEHSLYRIRSSGARGGRATAELWTELLRLRQVTAEPRILDDRLPRSASAKAEGLLEIISEVRDSGSRLLVFSQFTQTLKWLRSDLESEGISYLYLDGSTKRRQNLVDQFNRDESIPVFLLSLKAGGTGLNLTGADTVVHYDPWWNPAAEAQATDRAHRIGQKRRVQSLKLIGSDTVEEKVVQMQDDKRALLGDLFEGGAGSSPVMSLDALAELFEENPLS